MNKPNKCKNCQWYGKPYWSIINPCDNCPNETIETIISINGIPVIKKKQNIIEQIINNDDNVIYIDDIADKMGSLKEGENNGK